MKITQNKIHNKVYYGRLKIDTRIGELEYSYQLHSNPEMAVADDNWQLESTLTNYHELTAEELDEIYDLIKEELYRSN